MFEDPSVPRLNCAGRPLLLDRPRIMGIVNVTPDSFSDGGRLPDVDDAVAHGLRLVEEGADILDIGGESTRPGADEVPEALELTRVIPVIERLAAATAVPISIDTSKPAVMRAAVAVGAGMINDVRALRAEGAAEAAAELGVAVCLMHMLGESPRAMQAAPEYDDVVASVQAFLAERLFACELAGIDRRQIVIDPGFGFGKTLEHNLRLLRQLERLRELGPPLMVGLSRKSMLGVLTGREVGERLAGSLAAAVIAAQHGARIIRVHDVAATRDALAVWTAVAAQPGASARPPPPRRITWPDEE
jgi:dihydropteroate synthase